MVYHTLSRILFILMVINEIIVVLRSSEKERSEIVFPRAMPLPLLLVIIPFFVRLDLPDWLALLAVLGQAAGLIIEILGERQLLHARSFSINTDAAINPQTSGMYRLLEHPIYIGILLQVSAWSLFMPLAFIGVIMQYEAFRTSANYERVHLASLGIVHRGLDKFLWG